MPMNDEQQWYDFREQALKSVRAGFAPERLPGCTDRLLLRLMEYPAFDLVIGWHIYQRQLKREGTMHYIANRIQWLQPDDGAKFASPLEKVKYIRLAGSSRLKPALTFTSVDVEAEVIESVLAQLQAIHIPLIPSAHSLGIDGEFYELATADPFANICVHWWGDAQAEWQPVGELVMELLQTLDGSLK